MLHSVHQLVSDCVRLLYVSEQEEYSVGPSTSEALGSPDWLKTVKLQPFKPQQLKEAKALCRAELQGLCGFIVTGNTIHITNLTHCS